MGGSKETIDLFFVEIGRESFEKTLKPYFQLALIFTLFFCLGCACCGLFGGIYLIETSKQTEATAVAKEKIDRWATEYAGTHQVVTPTITFKESPVALASPTATPVVLSQINLDQKILTIVQVPNFLARYTPTSLVVNTPLPTSTNIPLPTLTSTPLPILESTLSPMTMPMPTLSADMSMPSLPTPTPASVLALEKKSADANLAMSLNVEGGFDYKLIKKEQWDPCRNHGNHIIAIYVLDSNGSGIPNVQLRVFWGNGGPDEQAIIATGQKPEISPGYVEFDMYGDGYSVQILDSSNEIASGLGYSGPDQACHESGRENPVGNSQGHYSWDVVFQRTY